MWRGKFREKKYFDFVGNEYFRSKIISKLFQNCSEFKKRNENIHSKIISKLFQNCYEFKKRNENIHSLRGKM